jgi:trehalose 6-phosphate synthase/phosphatase
LLFGHESCELQLWFLQALLCPLIDIVLRQNFGEYDMWLAAEHEMFLYLTMGEWMTTMPEHFNMEWVDIVRHVLEYFTKRTPRSHFEPCETSLLKYL